MDEYIEREALITKFKKMELGEHGLVERLFADGVYAVIAAFPAADVAPVVRGHKVDDGGFYARCSQCDGVLPLCANYCPNCGAKMDGGDNNAAD